MLTTIQDLWEEGRKTLSLALFPEREEELLLIFLDILQIQRHELTLYRQQALTQAQQEQFFQIIHQRKTHKPLAYLLGYQYFYGYQFPVSEKTLIPRYDTEILVESVTKYFDSHKIFNVLDICTGTGIIALTLAKLFPKATVHGIDIVSQPFLNSQLALNLLEDRISFQCQDFLDPSSWEGQWECITSNPPYLNEQDIQALDKQVYDFEPHSALYADEGGLKFYRYIANFCDSHLKNGGYLFLEIDYKYQKIIDFFDPTFYETATIVQDLTNLPRVMIIRKKTFA